MTVDNFSRNLAISIAGHVILVVLIFVRAITAPADRIDIRNAIRVDLVALPQKAQQLPEQPVEKPAPAPPPAAAAKPPPPVAKPEVVPPKPQAPTVPDLHAKQKNTEKAEKRAMEKLKALEALERLKQEVAHDKAASKRAAVAGNQVNVGNSLTGLDRIEFDRYFDDLQSKVRAAWNIPQWLADQDLHAEVLVVIDERGIPIKKVIQKSSGNQVFDTKVLEAIESSSPWPPPPQRLRGRLSSSGIVFKFPQ